MTDPSTVKMKIKTRAAKEAEQELCQKKNNLKESEKIASYLTIDETTTDESYTNRRKSRMNVYLDKIMDEFDIKLRMNLTIKSASEKNRYY